MVAGNRGGRPPKPTPLHEAQGTYRNDRHGSRSEPQYAVGLPEPPAHLDIVAKRRYADVGALLVSQRVMTEADRDMLALYATSYANWVEADREVRREQRLQARIEKAWDEIKWAVGDDDQDRFDALEKRLRRVERMKAGESPWVKRSREERLMMDRFGGQLGLSPSMRSKVTAAAPEEKRSEMEEMLG